MKIEIERLEVETFSKKEDYQREVIEIILSDRKWNIFYMGLLEDMAWKYKHNLFYRYKNGYNNANIKKKWNGLLQLMDGDKYIIITWRRLTDKCIYKEKKEKINKDGTPRKIRNAE